MNNPMIAAMEKPIIEKRMPLCAAATTDDSVRVSASGSVGSIWPSSRRTAAITTKHNAYVSGLGPTRRIVVYDGIHVQAKGATTTQKIRGFLQSAAGAARVLQITSRGAANPTDETTVIGAGTTTIANNLFAGSLSPDSDRSWANPVTTVTPTMPGANGGAYGEQLTLTSRYTNPATYGCQTWAAIAFSTPVADTDSDGLIDVLETGPAGVSALTDPNGAAEASALSLNTLVLPDMATSVTPIVYAIPVQLIAYHTAVNMGTDVDQPRNLAKSVTVE